MSVPTIASLGTTTPRTLPVVSSTTAVAVATRIGLPASRNVMHVARRSPNLLVHQLLHPDQDQARLMSATSQRSVGSAPTIHLSGSLIGLLVSVVSSTMVVVEAMEIASKARSSVCNAAHNRSHHKRCQCSDQRIKPNNDPAQSPNRPSPVLQVMCVSYPLLWVIAITGSLSGATTRPAVTASSSTTEAAAATRIVSILKRIARLVVLTI